jgi:Histidine kinase-, DNA gyrase B-, and HSP90-like ATPase/PAS domain
LADEFKVNNLITHFAPAERATGEEIRIDHEKLRNVPLIRQLLDSFPEPAMLLNPQRQIVLANDKLLDLLGSDSDAILGLRPGEMLNCIHAKDEEAGCGTSKFCSQCGAVSAIWESGRTNTAQVRECRINRRSGTGFSALDLRVWGTPFALDGQFTVFAVRDITDEKRRAVLERVFFNEFLEIAAGLRGVLEPLPEASPAEAAEIGVTATDLSGELLEEIRSYRDLICAERGELKVNFDEIDAERLLVRLCADFRRHSDAWGKTIAPPTVDGPPMIQSDAVLLSRVLGHLIKNALEASSVGDTVRVAFENKGAPRFLVRNPSYMSERVQLQIFQRSFSTKAEMGRGIGTYSVKLLAERYLGGSVVFSSSAHDGTVFTVSLGDAVVGSTLNSGSVCASFGQAEVPVRSSGC